MNESGIRSLLGQKLKWNQKQQELNETQYDVPQ